MSKPLTPHGFDDFANAVISVDEDSNIAIVYGATVPTDATKGYMPGALFLQNDGSTGTLFYINQGTAASCDFNAADLTAAQKAFLDSLTATAAEVNAVADLSVNGAVVKTKVLPITLVASTSEQDTGWDLPTKAVVLNAFVDVTTLEATGTTKTVDVGLLSSETNGDADGFLDGVSVAAAGVKQGSLVAGSVTRGLLLRETVTGSGSATHSSPNTYSVSAGVARSVSYTLGSNDFAELVANIIIHYIEVA